jgi:hypothetical protein
MENIVALENTHEITSAFPVFKQFYQQINRVERGERQTDRGREGERERERKRRRRRRKRERRKRERRKKKKKEEEEEEEETTLRS